MSVTYCSVHTYVKRGCEKKMILQVMWQLKYQKNRKVREKVYIDGDLNNDRTEMAELNVDFILVRALQFR